MLNFLIFSDNKHQINPKTPFDSFIEIEKATQEILKKDFLCGFFVGAEDGT